MGLNSSLKLFVFGSVAKTTRTATNVMKKKTNETSI